MCTLYGNVNHLLYEKLMGQPKLIQICMCREISVFFSIITGLFVVSILKFVLTPMASHN